jgi:uncharacterized protein YhaN
MTFLNGIHYQSNNPMNTTPQPPSPEQLALTFWEMFSDESVTGDQLRQKLYELASIIRERDELKQANAELNNECQNHVEHMKSFREKAEALDAIQSKPNQSSSA